MFYDNPINLKNITYKKIKYATFANGLNTDYDENLLPVKYSKNSYNFDFRDGALRDGIGLSIPTISYEPEDASLLKEITFSHKFGVKGCWLYNAWNDIAGVITPIIITYCTDGNIYYCYLHHYDGLMKKVEGLTFRTKPIVMNYRLNGVDTLFLVTEEEGMYSWVIDGVVTAIPTAQKITSMCVHYERLWITTAENTRRIWFSDDLNPTNFNISSTEGGFIDLVDDFGLSNKVVSFDGYLYVFRDYNIARISAYGDQNEFSVVQLYVSNGKIFSDSVCICGNKIMFLASDGIYTFNGSSATKLNLNINKYFEGISNEGAVAGYSEGYYYLSCKLKFNDDKVLGCEAATRCKNNALIKINVSTGEYSILRGYEILDICVINDTLASTVFAIVKEGDTYSLAKVDMSGECFGEPTEKVWEAPVSDFGYLETEKLIREIYIDTKSDCQIKINVDGKEKTYSLTGKDKTQKIKPYLKGDKFAISFISNVSNTKISNPQVIVGIL